MTSPGKKPAKSHNARSSGSGMTGHSKIDPAKLNRVMQAVRSGKRVAGGYCDDLGNPRLVDEMRAFAEGAAFTTASKRVSPDRSRFGGFRHDFVEGAALGFDPLPNPVRYGGASDFDRVARDAAKVMRDFDRVARTFGVHRKPV